VGDYEQYCIASFPNSDDVQGMVHTQGKRPSTSTLIPSFKPQPSTYSHQTLTSSCHQASGSLFPSFFSQQPSTFSIPQTLVSKSSTIQPLPSTIPSTIPSTFHEPPTSFPELNTSICKSYFNPPKSNKKMKPNEVRVNLSAMAENKRLVAERQIEAIARREERELAKEKRDVELHNVLMEDKKLDILIKSADLKIKEVQLNEIKRRINEVREV